MRVTGGASFCASVVRTGDAAGTIRSVGLDYWQHCPNLWTLSTSNVPWSPGGQPVNHVASDHRLAMAPVPRPTPPPVRAVRGSTDTGTRRPPTLWTNVEPGLGLQVWALSCRTSALPPRVRLRPLHLPRIPPRAERPSGQPPAPTESSTPHVSPLTSPTVPHIGGSPATSAWRSNSKIVVTSFVSRILHCGLARS